MMSRLILLPLSVCSTMKACFRMVKYNVSFEALEYEIELSSSSRGRVEIHNGVVCPASGDQLSQAGTLQRKLPSICR